MWRLVSDQFWRNILLPVTEEEKKFASDKFLLSDKFLSFLLSTIEMNFFYAKEIFTYFHLLQSNKAIEKYRRKMLHRQMHHLCLVARTSLAALCYTNDSLSSFHSWDVHRNDSADESIILI